MRTAQLENVFEKTLAQVRQLFDSESTRIVKVDRLLLEAENDHLRLRCQQADKEILELVEAESDLRQRLVEAHHEISDLKAALRTNSRTVQDLKVYTLPHFPFFPLFRRPNLEFFLKFLLN